MEDRDVCETTKFVIQVSLSADDIMSCCTWFCGNGKESSVFEEIQIVFEKLHKTLESHYLSNSLSVKYGNNVCIECIYKNLQPQQSMQELHLTIAWY